MEETLDQEEREDWLLQAATQKILRRLQRDFRLKQERVLGLSCTGTLEELRIAGAEARTYEGFLKLLKGDSK